MIFWVPFCSLCVYVGWLDELSTDGMKYFWICHKNKTGQWGAMGVQMAITIDTVRWHTKISSEVPFYFGMYLTFSWVWSLEIKSWNYGSKSGLWIGVKPSLGWLIGPGPARYTQIISWKGRPTLAFRIAWDFESQDIQRTVQKAQEKKPSVSEDRLKPCNFHYHQKPSIWELTLK